MPPSPSVSATGQRLSAQTLVEQLMSTNLKIVLAESCTCGMAAALIGGVPGASKVFCGSAVTYRPSVKQQWLGVDGDLIARHTTESRETTEAMADGLLKTTPEADLAAAITGHLGPGAPADQDGIVYVSLRSRVAIGENERFSDSFRLQETSRVDRQIEAAGRWLGWISDLLVVSG